MPISLSHFIYALCNKSLQVLDWYLNPVKQLSNCCCFIKKLIACNHPKSQTFWSLPMFTASSHNFHFCSPLNSQEKIEEEKSRLNCYGAASFCTAFNVKHACYTVSV